MASDEARDITEGVRFLKIKQDFSREKEKINLKYFRIGLHIYFREPKLELCRVWPKYLAHIHFKLTLKLEFTH